MTMIDAGAQRRHRWRRALSLRAQARPWGCRRALPLLRSVCPRAQVRARV